MLQVTYTQKGRESRTEVVDKSSSSHVLLGLEMETETKVTVELIYSGDNGPVRASKIYTFTTIHDPEGTLI